jgi:hypothetical protein
MNHSMYSADRSTHLKIVVAALVAGIAVMGIAVSSHLNSNVGTMAVVKAGKPVVMTSADVTLTR